jgi:hypothetical protein
MDASKLSADIAALVIQDSVECTRAQATDFAQEFILAWRSVNALAPALSKLETSATPATARALQATENVWRDIESRYDMLTSTEVAEALHAKGANRAYASNLRKTNRLIGIQRRNAFVFPSFQLDAATGRVHDCIQPLLEMTDSAGWSSQELALWLCSPSGLFRGDAPVDHISETVRILDAATNATTAQW